jgi:hypothetical protein
MNTDKRVYDAIVPVKTAMPVEVSYFEPSPEEAQMIAAGFEPGKYACTACQGPLDTPPRMFYRLRVNGEEHSKGLCDHCLKPHVGRRRLDHWIIRRAGIALAGDPQEEE